MAHRVGEVHFVSKTTSTSLTFTHTPVIIPGTAGAPLRTGDTVTHLITELTTYLFVTDSAAAKLATK